MLSRYVSGYYAGFRRFLPYFIFAYFLTRGLKRFWRGFLGWEGVTVEEEAWKCLVEEVMVEN